MNPEPAIQNEVSQKEKTKYSVLTHIYVESGKTVLVNYFQGRNRDADTEGLWTQREGEGGMG